MSTVETRYQKRIALKEAGFKRVSASHDSGDGCYAEMYADDEGNTVVISWAPRTEMPVEPPARLSLQARVLRRHIISEHNVDGTAPMLSNEQEMADFHRKDHSLTEQEQGGLVRPHGTESLEFDVARVDRAERRARR